MACATAGRVRIADPPRRFARVKVARSRIIRTVVGLRPFRPAGFVIRGEKRDDKTIVHDYGHGGAGVSLSWGTAQLAVDEAEKTGSRRYAVLGCGAVGLATARLLQRRGYDVTLYARDLPPATTSNIAGAQWGTFSVVDPDKRTPALDAQLLRAATFSHRVFQDLVGTHYGVRWIENYVVSGSRPTPRGRDEVADSLARLSLDSQELSPHEHPFDAAYVRRFTTMLIEPLTYLDALLRDFLLSSGTLVVRDFPDVASILALAEPVVMNCTGLGSRALFGDEELIPAKGQLTVLLPQPEVDYIVLGDNNLYMFPRQDGILLGGTFERGDWSLEPNPIETERILTGHTNLFRGMR